MKLMFTLSAATQIIHRKIELLYSFLLNPQWAQFWEPWQAQKDWKENQKDWKEKIQDLQQQFEEFWEQKNLQRGAAAFGRRPPL